MTEYLIRFAQVHESFRRPELEALSKHADLELDIVRYSPDSPFCVVRFPSLSSSTDHSHVSDETCSDTGNGRCDCSVQDENLRIMSDSSRDTMSSTITTGMSRNTETKDIRIRDFHSRSILSKAVYELWGQGTSYVSLHEDIKRRSLHFWEDYKLKTFKFSIDAYLHTRSLIEQKEIIEGFRYLGFKGKIVMKNPEVEFVVFEEWDVVNGEGGNGGHESVQLSSSRVVDDKAVRNDNAMTGLQEQESNAVDNAERMIPTKRILRQIYFGRKISYTSHRSLIEKHDLKKRPYISTTSMDAELALITVNLALAAPGKLLLDPFVGTGGFMLAAAELGAMTLGSDIDGRSFRGKGSGLQKGIGKNFEKYGLTAMFGDCITSDLINSCFRSGRGARWLDGIVSDPPYGVREGLKVLGTRKPAAFEGIESETIKGLPSQLSTPAVHMIGGVPAYTLPGYIAPKKPYSFDRMLDDILEFATCTLVDGGRLAFWMPSANENEDGVEEVTVIPQHPMLVLKHECIQRFNKWSRRLLVYERLPESEGGRGDDNATEVATLKALHQKMGQIRLDGTTADELNPFRKRYFQAFGDSNTRKGSDS